MKKGWMVRAGEGGYLISEFEKANCVAIGWNELGDMANIKDRDELKERMTEIWSDWSEVKLGNNVGQVYKFLFEISEGDILISYDTSKREYLVGEATGRYKYEPNRIPVYDQTIPVKWLRRVSRDDLSIESRNSLGSALSVFSLGDHVLGEINTILKGEKPLEVKAEPDEEAELGLLERDIEERSNEFIKDKILKLEWEEMQDFAAGILRGMGYRTKVSEPGPDGGKDIIASPDGLGIQQPRIKVQVKHRKKERIGVDGIRSFIGVLRQHEIGLFVSTGGFTKESRTEAEKAQTPITLISLEDLVSLYKQNYEKLDPDTKALVPLKRIYWPS